MSPIYTLKPITNQKWLLYFINAAKVGFTVNKLIGLLVKFDSQTNFCVTFIAHLQKKCTKDQWSAKYEKDKVHAFSCILYQNFTIY